MVPEGWKEHLLQELCEEKVVYGIVQAGDHFDGGIPYIKSSDVGGEINVCNLVKTDPAIHSRYKRSTVRPGDIVFSLRGNTGETSIVPDHLNEANLTQGTARIAVNSKTDNRFLRYQLGSQSVRSQVYAVSKGSTFTEISLADLRRIPIPLPPLPEQKKIAEILSTWDRAIETTEKLLANAEAQKKALMQQLLTGKRRLKGFEGEWKEVQLGSLAYVDKSSLSSKTDPNYEFLYISLSDVEPGHIAHKLPRFRFSDAPSRARRRVSPRDILFSTVRPNLLGFARVEADHEGCIASTGFAVISCKKGVDPAYVYHYLFGRHIRSQIHGLVVGSNYPAVNSSEVRQLRLRIPNLDEQQAISSILDHADHSIAVASSQIKRLKTEKRALMQQLLTGKRRVTV